MGENSEDLKRFTLLIDNEDVEFRDATIERFAEATQLDVSKVTAEIEFVIVIVKAAASAVSLAAALAALPRKSRKNRISVGGVSYNLEDLTREEVIKILDTADDKSPL